VRLRTYQQQAAADLVAVLQKHRVAYLRGEVRVGKTFTALEALKRLGAKSCLIVTKKKGNPIHRSGS
jgi:superfamily II DNA or RNA helicase